MTIRHPSNPTTAPKCQSFFRFLDIADRLTDDIRVNCILADLCTESNYAFLEHANIYPSKHLNSSKVHLNKVGDNVFESNLLRALNF